jgi:DNA-binding transcriptional MerR regulator
MLDNILRSIYTVTESDNKMKPKNKAEISKITNGLPTRQIQFYTDEGLVKAAAGGGVRGSRLLYDADGVFRFLVIKALWDYKMTIGTVRAVLAFFDQFGHKPEEIIKMRKNGDEFFIAVYLKEGKHEETMVIEMVPGLNLTKFIKGMTSTLLINISTIADQVAGLK